MLKLAKLGQIWCKKMYFSNKNNFDNNLVVGLTGNIGSGKTFVLNYFKQKGFFTLNADDVVKEEYAKKSFFYKKILEIFGNKILNKDLTVNRKKILDLILKDEKLFKKMNSVTELFIVEEIKNKIIFAKMHYRFSVIEVPLLFEMNMQDFFDLNLLLCVDENILKNRILNDRMLDEKYFNFLKKNQLSQLEKIKRLRLPDYVVFNNTNKKILEKKLNYFIKKLGN
jgi:dephospho-CoA kinase